MAEKSVIIIGAGIAGPSAGCYLQMNGHSTQVFESHSIPGGLCTAWQSKGYTITNSTSWVQGSSPSDTYCRLWNELIDMKNVEFVNHSEYLRVEDGHAGCIRILTDLDKLEHEFLTKAPEDRRLIREFVGAARRFAKLDMPADLIGMAGPAGVILMGNRGAKQGCHPVTSELVDGSFIIRVSTPSGFGSTISCTTTGLYLGNDSRATPCIRAPCHCKSVATFTLIE